MASARGDGGVMPGSHAANGNGTLRSNVASAPIVSTRSPPAQQVEQHSRRALDLVTQWMNHAWQDGEAPICKWQSSEHLAKARREQLATNPCASPWLLFPPLGEAAALSEDQLFAVLDQTLQDSVNPWTGRFLDKLYTAPTTLSPALELITASLNASPAVSSAAPALCLAEEQTVDALAKVLGWQESLADGLTMPGGSASNVLAVQTALGNAFPSFKTAGILGVVSDLTAMHGRAGRGARPLLVTSEQSHYSLEKAALACGMGMDSVVKVRCDGKGRMDVGDLERVLGEAMANLDGSGPGMVAGFPFFVNATSGTTILGAFDDISAIVATCRRLHSSSPPSIWIHADCSWGGAAIFSARFKHLMAGVEQVDSITFNPHKVLNVTQQCSFALFRRGETLGVNVTGAKYLFHGDQHGRPSRDYLRRNPGAKTMGCARRADAFKFYIEWLRVGSAGLEEHVERGIDHASRLTEVLLERYSKTLELSKATAEPVFLQLCIRPKLPSSLRPLVEEALAGLGEELPCTPSQLHYHLLSNATHAVHERLRSQGTYQVDKAPVHYPPGSGYYIRLVTHPNTPFDVLLDVVAEIDRLGMVFFGQLQTSLEQAEGLSHRRDLLLPLVDSE